MHLFKEVVEWAEARNIIKGSSFDQQWLKLISEVGELADNLAKGRYEAAKDDIGDSLVVSYILMSMTGVVEEQFPSDLEGFFKKLFEDNAEFSLNDRMHAVISLLADAFSEKEAGACASVCLAIVLVAEALGFTYEECLDVAYSEIKDRKGRMENGVFIKEGDVA